jgi:hypothetical protein
MKLFKLTASNSNSKAAAKARVAAGRVSRSARSSTFEMLEDRTLYSTYTVNVLGDPSVASANHLSLRQALVKANTAGGTSLIQFSSSVFNTPQTINLESELTVTNHTAKITINGPAKQLTLSDDGNMLMVGKNATLTVNNVNFMAPDGGEGVIVQNAGTLTLNSSDLTGTPGLNDMAGVANTGTLKLSKVTIENHGDGNSGIAFGAGLQNSGSATLSNVTFSEDDAGYGGAIAQSGGTLTGVNVTFSENGADTNAKGGAIAINGGSASLTNSTIDHSWIEAEGTPGSYYGVALFADHSKVRLFDDTITNSAVYPVGFGSPGDVPTGGAVTIGGHGEVTMGNSVVSGMSEVAGAVLGTGPEVIGYLNSVGHNLIGQIGASTFGLKASDLRGTHASPLNPKLGALANNGGFVQTELPLLGSPLINAGSNSLIPTGTTTDERGINRIFGGTVDIGAVETDYLIIHWPIVLNLFNG